MVVRDVVAVVAVVFFVVAVPTFGFVECVLPGGGGSVKGGLSVTGAMSGGRKCHSEISLLILLIPSLTYNSYLNSIVDSWARHKDRRNKIRDSN